MHDQSSQDVYELEKAARAAIDDVAEIAESAVVQKEHDARMMSAAAGSVTAVRQVLEAEVRRARVFAWAALGAGLAVAAASTGMAVLVDRESRASERGYQDRLLKESAKRISLEGALAGQESLNEALQLEQQRGYESLQDAQARLSQALGLLGEAQAGFMAASRDSARRAEGSRPAESFVTWEEHQQVWELLHVAVDGLVARLDPPGSPPPAPPDSFIAEEIAAASGGTLFPFGASRSPAVALLTLREVPSLTVPGDCDAATHDCYVNYTGSCTTP
jgi:hypothetical protein